jgi:hypothetical protein
MTRNPDDLYSFVACHYYATGEGSTISLLITRAYPRTDDYEVPPETVYTDGKYQFNPGVVKVGPGFRAIREFAEVFGSFIARGAELYNYESFMAKFGHHLPEYMQKIGADDDPPGNLNYFSQIHLNFS